MFLDRQLQLAVLQELREQYPETVYVGDISTTSGSSSIRPTLFYLWEHGLVDCSGHPVAEQIRPLGSSISISHARITAAGLDFLEDDGGLSAILGKVVVKFDDNDLAMLLRAVDLSEAPVEDKNTFKNILKSLSADGLKTAYIHLVKRGLDNLPAALHLIQTMMGGR